jgi:hypothetical protein
MRPLARTMALPRSRPSSSDDERRRWPRAAADIAATVALDGGSSPARVRDISRAGVCFYLDRPIALMTVLELRMSLPVEGGVRQVTGQGAVVRSEKISAHLDHYEIAVFLHEMADPDRKCIEDYVRRWRSHGAAAAH